MASRRKRNGQKANDVSNFEINEESIRISQFNENKEGNSKFNIQDIENVIRKFSGEGAINVKKWLEEFEQYADTFHWNNLERFVFCKRLLKGAAKLYVECEAKPLNFQDLKSLLLKEFQAKICSADVHKILRERKKKNEESFREYLYRMIDIASQVEMEETSIIQYVIEGIQDTPNNKMVLYGSKSIEELKNNLLIYEKIKNEAKRNNNENSENKKKMNFVRKNEERRSSRHCFNCGSTDHEFYKCPEKGKGPKCFNCNNFGHTKIHCPNKNINENLVSSHIVTKNEMLKEVKINNENVQALIDTGSDVCLLKESCFEFIKPKYICKNNSISVSGLGKTILTKGSCMVNVEIDGQLFNNVEFHIIGNNFMKIDLIIGMSLLRKAIIEINAGKVNLITKEENQNKIEEKIEKETEECFLAKIKVDKDIVKEPDISNILDDKTADEIVLMDEKPESHVTMRSKTGKKNSTEKMISVNAADGKENIKQQQNHKRGERRSWKTEELSYLGENNAIEEVREKIKEKEKSKKSKDLKDSKESKESKESSITEKHEKSEKSDKQEKNEQHSGKKKKDEHSLSVVSMESVQSESAEFHVVVTKKKKAKKDIAKIQEENRKYYNKKRKKGTQYAVGDLVAIEKTQYGTGLKIRPKFLGPYRVIAVKGFDRYLVEKEGEHEGPIKTSSSGDKMKRWTNEEDEDEEIINLEEDNSSEADE